MLIADFAVMPRAIASTRPRTGRRRHALPDPSAGEIVFGILFSSMRQEGKMIGKLGRIYLSILFRRLPHSRGRSSLDKELRHQPILVAGGAVSEMRNWPDQRTDKS
jgi:hypothetical protein